MTSITNGLYEITSALSDDLFVGRLSPEDMSLLPKAIVALQRGEGEAPRPVCTMPSCIPELHPPH